MGGPRSKATPEEISAAFRTEEGFKAVAKRLGMSPNTLRKRWKTEFGEEAFKERGKRLQAQAAAKQARAMATNRVYRDVDVPCSLCGSITTLKSNQVAQMNVVTFTCDGCKYDRFCPVCLQPVDGVRGLSGHFRHRREARDEDQILYEKERESARWQGQVEGEDFVVCLECALKAQTLARHLKAAHGITAEEYRAKHGSGARIRSEALTRKRSEALRSRESAGKGTTKITTCPGCGVEQAVSRFLGPLHDHRCPGCRQIAEEARWAGKTEPEDYVTCLECGHRAENLTSHVQNTHQGYREKHPKAFMVAVRSAVRDKAALRGLKRPPEFGQKIAEVKRLGLTLSDFEPFLEPGGAVDHREMMKSVGCAWPTLKRYMDSLGLAATKKYMEQAAAERRVTLTADQLAPFRLKNDKVSIAKAMSGLGYSFPTIRKECLRLGLSTFHRRIRQTICLDAVSEALGGASI